MLEVYCEDCESHVSLEQGEEYCPECGAYLTERDPYQDAADHAFRDYLQDEGLDHE